MPERGVFHDSPDVRDLDAEIEDRIRARTEELSRAVAALNEEIETRKGAERTLQETRQFLDLVIENIYVGKLEDVVRAIDEAVMAWRSKQEAG